MIRLLNVQILAVHGGIRHLENHLHDDLHRHTVHGGIRHLEIRLSVSNFLRYVHGGIRHLEKSNIITITIK